MIYIDCMKTFHSHPLKNPVPSRIASLVAIMLWSAHYHSGQWSREYRMGCRARNLINRSNEIGDYLASTWFDNLEGYVTGGPIPTVYTRGFSEKVKETYDKLAAM